MNAKYVLNIGFDIIMYFYSIFKLQYAYLISFDNIVGIVDNIFDNIAECIRVFTNTTK